MNIVGISAFGQNPAACLIINGKLIAFAEEERFIRIKSAFGHFPLMSLKYCLQEGKIGADQIDEIALGWDYNKYHLKMPIFYAYQWLKYSFLKFGNSGDRVLANLINTQPAQIKKQLIFNLRMLGSKKKLPEVHFISHHLAHAASAYYCSGFSDSLIIVIDGSGEERTTSIYKGAGLEIKEINHFNIPNSLGWLYAATTAYLGFIPYENDGFVMGLAPYGKPDSSIEKKISKIIKTSIGSYQIDPEYLLLGKHSFNEHFSDKYVSLFGSPRSLESQMLARHKNLAYAVQEKLEEVVSELVKKNQKLVSSKNLCLSGGVALNCKMNGKIATSGLVDNIFVQPASHDSGSALGAAMIVSANKNNDPRFTMQHAFWGPAYKEKEIRHVLDQSMVPYKKIKNIERKTAQALSKGKIVARFSGRMEIGPRALGSRSILANPCIKGMNDIVNRKVKHRDQWRPFCPSIINEEVNNYVEKPMEDRFMTVIYDVKKSKRNRIPSVVHIDGTTRPQSVDKKTDPKYHRLISYVGTYTGNPVVLNTSFNIKGEPIVCTPLDALKSFFATGIDALAMENFWIEKK